VAPLRPVDRADPARRRLTLRNVQELQSRPALGRAGGQVRRRAFAPRSIHRRGTIQTSFTARTASNTS
jgi:hypothetical protein